MPLGQGPTPRFFAYLSFAILPDIFFAQLHLGVSFYPSANGLTEFIIRNPNHLNVLNFWVVYEKMLDFGRVDVLPAANDHFFRSAYDGHASIFVHYADVTKKIKDLP